MTDHMPDELVRFDSKIVVVVREELPTWQKLNMTAFLVSAIGTTAPECIGEPYRDADGTEYLPMFGQPVLVFAATAAELKRTVERAVSRETPLSIFTMELFRTGHDAANRAAVAAVPRADLDLAGLALRTDRKVADKITSGLKLHA